MRITESRGFPPPIISPLTLMAHTTPLLRCAHCGSSTLDNVERIEHDRGEWFLRCHVCNAENVLVYPSETFSIEIAGWRD
ncbi:MAG: hypothetical protein ABI882_18160 [Acidobacteriota bacterium]